MVPHRVHTETELGRVGERGELRIERWLRLAGDSNTTHSLQAKPKAGAPVWLPRRGSVLRVWPRWLSQPHFEHGFTAELMLGALTLLKVIMLDGASPARRHREANRIRGMWPLQCTVQLGM